jgi:hypothetical protein
MKINHKKLTILMDGPFGDGRICGHLETGKITFEEVALTPVVVRIADMFKALLT